MLSYIPSKGKLLENTYRTFKKPILVLLRAQLASTKEKHYCSFYSQKVSKSLHFYTNMLKTIITVVANINRGEQRADPSTLTPTTEDTSWCD